MITSGDQLKTSMLKVTPLGPFLKLVLLEELISKVTYISPNMVIHQGVTSVIFKLMEQSTMVVNNNSSSETLL